MYLPMSAWVRGGERDVRVLRMRAKTDVKFESGALPQFAG